MLARVEHRAPIVAVSAPAPIWFANVEKKRPRAARVTLAWCSRTERQLSPITRFVAHYSIPGVQHTLFERVRLNCSHCASNHMLGRIGLCSTPLLQLRYILSRLERVACSSMATLPRRRKVIYLLQMTLHRKALLHTEAKTKIMYRPSSAHTRARGRPHVPKDSLASNRLFESYRHKRTHLAVRVSLLSRALPRRA